MASAEPAGRVAVKLRVVKVGVGSVFHVSVAVALTTGEFAEVSGSIAASTIVVLPKLPPVKRTVSAALTGCDSQKGVGPLGEIVIGGSVVLLLSVPVPVPPLLPPPPPPPHPEKKREYKLVLVRAMLDNPILIYFLRTIFMTLFDFI
jgi:hypothetical protein